MIRLIVLLIILALPIEAAAQSNVEASTPEKVFDAKTRTLENGMEVYVVENNRVPVVTHMVWYKVGAADEPMAKSGIAHFLEHLLFKGSDGLEPGEFSKIIRNLGGNDNAFTSQDYTAYFQSIASEHLEKVMTMEAGRMRGATMPEKEVLSERKVILEERRQRTDNNPNAKFSESLNAALFVNHPYGIPVIGWAHEMETLSREDAYGFYDKWYGPNNAILVVSGDVKAEEVFDLARKIYGPLEKAKIPERIRPQSPPLVGQQEFTYHDAAVQQPVYQRSYRVPSYRQSKDEALAMQVLEDIFGSGATSQLYKSLVIDQKLATSAALSYRSSAWDDATLWVYASPVPGVTMEQVQTAIDAEIKKLADNGVTEEQLAESIKRLQNEAIYARDSLTGPAMAIGYSLVTGSTLDDIEYWPRNIGNVTAEQIQNLAKKYLVTSSDDAHYVDGYLLPAEKKNDESVNIETEKLEAPIEETAPANDNAPAQEEAAEEVKQ